MPHPPASFLVVEGLGPYRPTNRLAGKLLKSLPQEFRTGPPSEDLLGLAAFLSHRSDAGKSLDLLGHLKTLAVRSEGGQQTRPQSGACSGQTGKEIMVGMSAKQFGNLPVELFDGRQQRTQLSNQADQHQAHGFQDRPVPGQGEGQTDLLDALLDQFLLATVVLGLELLQASRRSFLHGWQGGPTLQEVTSLQRG